MRWENSEFYKDGLLHTEAAIYLLKKSGKEMKAKEIYEMMKGLKLRRKVSSINSLYAMLNKLKYKGILDYRPLTREWRISKTKRKI